MSASAEPPPHRDRRSAADGEQAQAGSVRSFRSAGDEPVRRRSDRGAHVRERRCRLRSALTRLRRLKIRLFGSGPRSPVALDGRPALDLAWPRLATPGPTTECRHHRHRCTHRPSRSVSAAVPAA